MSVYPLSYEADVHGFKGERVLMRIYVEEQDTYHGRPLFEAIVELLHDRKYAGATAFQGILGFGASSTIHRERILTLTADQPILIECIDTSERIQAIVPEIDRMMGGGLITLEQVRVILYRKDISDQERSGDAKQDARIDITGSWRVAG